MTITCNVADNAIALYIDGMLQDSATGAIDCGNGQIVTVQDIGNLMIGELFHGKIDDVVIYNRVLTMAEIHQLHELAPCCE